MKRIKTPTIVQPSGRKLLLLLSMLLIALLVQGWQVFNLGRMRGGFESEQVAQKTQQYVQKIDEQQQDISALRTQSARYKREAQVEREAGRRLQQELIQLHKEGDESRNEVALLRSLMSKKSGSLYIKRFEVHPTEILHQYRYQLIVAQALDNVGITKGKLTISIIGQQEGKSKRIKQKEFSEGAGAFSVLEFKHYQNVTGLINLQEGFEPESVEMEVQPKSSKQRKMNAQFVWEVIDAGSNGQEEADAGT